LESIGYLGKKNSWIIYVELISVQPAPPISGAGVRPKCVENIGPQTLAESDIILLVHHNLHDAV
jgi:hypothetical protein